jgi:hypothetical protein
MIHLGFLAFSSETDVLGLDLSAKDRCCVVLHGNDFA